MFDSPLIPHCDLPAGLKASRDEIIKAVTRVIDRGWFILGEEVEKFENEFSAFHGLTTAAVGVANGTDAICIALKACGLKPGDGVITVSHTAVATVAAIEQGGFVPILSDIEPDRHTIDPDSILDSLIVAKEHGIRVKAILPVHLYGHPAQLDEITRIAKDENLLLVEDCSQAHAATFKEQFVGTFGDAAAWSLYPTKNLAALGDAGVIVSPNPDVLEKAKLIRQYGWKVRNRSECAGMNSRLDEIQAAILRVRLRQLDETTSARCRIAARYTAGLQDLGICPSPATDVRHVWHQYVITIPDRDQVMAKMKERGVSTMIHYPIPIHLQPAYRDRVLTSRNMSNTVKSASTVLSLPMYPEISNEDIDRVIDVLHELLD